MDLKNHTIINMGLELVFKALKFLGNPQHKLPPVIHYAGTNGKGSTIAFTKAILNSAGYSCHVYTSPHLIRLNERIILADQEISDAELELVIKEVNDKCSHLDLSYFEVTTLAGFLAFSRNKADFLLLETGLGGRLDATNIMGVNGNPTPLAAVLTSISYDHTEFLGNEIEQIAYEKACILKKNAAAIVAKQEYAAAQQVILDYANKNQITAKNYGNDFEININQDGSFDYKSGGLNLHLSQPALYGEHQYYNAATAIALLSGLSEYSVTEQNIAEGLKTAKWPARLQNITDLFFKNSSKRTAAEIMLDGGHNVAAAQNLAKFLSHKHKNKKTLLILAMLKNKNIEGYLNQLKGNIDEIILTDIEGEESWGIDEVKDIADKLDIKISKIKNLPKIIEFLAENNSYELVVFAGSLYFSGQLLSFLQNSDN